LSTEKKINFSAGVVLLTFFAQFFITKELWIPNERDFPLIPYFSFLPIAFNKTIDTFLIFLTFVSFIFLIWKPKEKKYLLLFFIPSLLLILEDTIRLQPWFYLHLVMMGIITFEKQISKENVIRFLQWIVIAIYFWSGFNKLNIAFAWEIFPWFTHHLGIGEAYFLGMDNLNTFTMPAQNNIAFILPAFEITTAILLFIPRFRVIGIILVLFLHLVSLYAIGPWGHNWNQIVWPWNIEMTILTFLLFYPSEKSLLKNYLIEQYSLLKTKTGMALITLFYVLPAISFTGIWDKALSLHLYSGNSDEMEFYFDGYEDNLVNTSLAEHLYLDTTDMKSAMRVEYWAIEQTCVPMYNSKKYFKKVGKHLCDCLEHPENGGIRIFTRTGFYSRQDTLEIPCKDLE
jgi:hypothetical protein